MKIKELRELTGLSQTKFGDYLNIPMRTIQDWEAETRKPPEYVKELIEYKIKKEIEEKENRFNKIHGLLLEMIKEMGKVRLSNVEDNLDEIIEDLEELGYEVTVSHDFEGYLYATKI